MAVEPINIGIVGAGGNTRTMHIPKLQALDGVRVVSVCNRSRESSEKVAAEFGIPTVYDNWHELVDASDSNAIVIGTWPYMHCRVTLAALDADKHVMCEARMARNAGEAHAMLDASQEKPHLVTQIVPSPMTLKVDATVRRLIAEGYLGDLLAIEVRQAGPFIDRDAPMHWRDDFDLSGCNIMSLGIWYEALMRWVGEATSVMASGRTFVTTRRDPATGLVRPTRIPQHLDVIADMACGAQAHFLLSSVAGLAGAGGAWLYGSEGTLRIEGSKLSGAQRGAEALQEIHVAPEEAGAWRVEEEFVGAIRGEEKIALTDLETGVKYMEFTEAVTLSMQERQAVPLPL